MDNFNRRQLLGTGTMALGVMALGLGAKAQEMAPKMAMETKDSDIDLLQSALGVEQMMAAFYSQVLGAQEARAYLPPKSLEAVKQMSTHSASHVKTVWQAITNQQTEIGATPMFKFPSTAFVSPIGMAWLGYSIVEIAVGAHLYTLENLESRALRKAVISIVGSDTRQAAILRTLSGYQFAPRYFEAKLSPIQVASLTATYRS